MKLQNAVAFVTGANRGLGLAIVRELEARGVRKIYAAARNPDSVDLPGVIPVKLDVTNPAEVAAAAAACGDVNLLVNNAGIARLVNPLDPASIETGKEIFETNVYGLARVSQAFAPVLAANGGGAIANVLSVASWIASPPMAFYAASKSAAWAYTNALRTALARQGTQVLGLHVGYIDTDLTRGLEVPKLSPAMVAASLLDGVEAGQQEVLVDEVTQQVKAALSANPGVYLLAR